MRNVSGYLTDDGKFFQDKKEAEAHERSLGVVKLIEAFLRENLNLKTTPMDSVLQQWERYKTEMTK